MFKRFIKWDIAKDSKGEPVNVYQDIYGRIYIDTNVWNSEQDFLAIETGVFIRDQYARKRFIQREEIAKIQNALREHLTEFPY